MNFLNFKTNLLKHSTFPFTIRSHAKKIVKVELWFSREGTRRTPPPKISPRKTHPW